LIDTMIYITSRRLFKGARHVASHECSLYVPNRSIGFRPPICIGFGTATGTAAGRAGVTLGW